VNEKIGELLVKENLLTAEQLNNARDVARTKNERLGAQITSLGYLDENELTDFVAKQYGVPSIDLDEFEVDPELVLGVKLRAGGVELGWSVADYVSELESELLAAVPGDRTEDSSD